MKKIPTLFKREFGERHEVTTLPIVKPELVGILNGEGIATIKWDGSCCAIINGILYKRYDAKKGKRIPDDAIPCQDAPDPITGHLPCWVRCDINNPSDKWFFAAYDHYFDVSLLKCDDCMYDICNCCHLNGTYEAIGKHFQGNPYHLPFDILVPHGKNVIDVPRSYDGIRNFLQKLADDGTGIEGIVFWVDNKPVCKIKSSDFGIEWK